VTRWRMTASYPRRSCSSWRRKAHNLTSNRRRDQPSPKGARTVALGGEILLLCCWGCIANVGPIPEISFYVTSKPVVAGVAGPSRLWPPMRFGGTLILVPSRLRQTSVKAGGRDFGEGHRRNRLRSSRSEVSEACRRSGDCDRTLLMARELRPTGAQVSSAGLRVRAPHPGLCTW
jgi:hypothetical protein